jgi:K+-transporting ATPase ATPase C chain
VAQWSIDNPNTPEPKPEDLAVAFFNSYSKVHPGAFPSAVEQKMPDGKSDKRIEPVKEGADIQGIFFDMWRREHADADLEPVPADLVMASGSGLDPHITLKGALYQLDRVAAAWANKTGNNAVELKRAIDSLLHERAVAPLSGSVGVPLVNVLEVNLALRERMQALQKPFPNR